MKVYVELSKNVIVGLAALCAVAAAPVSGALAATGQEQASLRDKNFDDIGDQAKILFGAAKAGVIDADTIAAAAKLNELAKAAPTWFPKGSGPDDPGVTKTRALAEVWTKPEEFAAKMKAFQEASAALQPAVATKSMASFGPAVNALGGTCKGCHEQFKQAKKQ